MIERSGPSAAQRAGKLGEEPTSARVRALLQGGAMLRALAILSLAVTCSGCFLSPDSDDSPPIEEPLATAGAAEADWTLELGQSDGKFFTPMDDGEHVMKQHGPQGGYHVFVSAQLQGPDVKAQLEATKSAGGYAYVNVEVEVVAGTRIVSRSVSTNVATTDAETSVDFANLYAYVDADVHGDVTVSVKVATNDKSKWASASRQLFVDN